MTVVNVNSNRQGKMVMDIFPYGAPRLGPNGEITIMIYFWAKTVGQSPPATYIEQSSSENTYKREDQPAVSNKD